MRQINGPDRVSVTERARKLRAQYALQAQSLRTRIELRINRIPHALRKANVGDLCEKYQAAVKEVGLAKVLPEAVPEKPPKEDPRLAKDDSKIGYANSAPSSNPGGTKRTR